MKILFLSSLFNFGKKKIEILRIHFFILFPFFLLPLLLIRRPCAWQDPDQPCLQWKQASHDWRVSISRSLIAQRWAMQIEFAKEFQFLILIFRILRKTNWHSGTRIHPAKGIQATFYNTLIFKHHLGCWYNSEIMSPT